MIKFFKYEMNAQRITIYPKYLFRGIGIILMIVMLALSAIILLPILMIPDAHLSVSPLSLVLITIPFVPFFVVGNRKIVFDATDKTIYQTGLLGKKKLMTFDEANPISSVTITSNMSARNGYYYKITKKTNSYGKGYTISPVIGEGLPLLGRGQIQKDLKEYEEIVLPAIKKMMVATVSEAPQPETTQLNNNGALQYYRDDYNSRFVLKPATSTMIMSSVGLVAVLIILGNLIIRMQSTEGNYILPIVILVVLIYASLIGLGKRIVFLPQQQKIQITYFGYVRKEYSLTNFNRFVIVRKTTNAVYSGTHVNMEFRIQGSNKIDTLTLKSFMGTAKIEDFIAETKNVMVR